MAKQVFGLLEPVEAILINSNEYKLWSKYNDPQAYLQRKVGFYRGDEKSPLDTKFGKMEREYGERYFGNRMAMLICLLIENEQRAEATRIAEETSKESAAPEFRALVERAKLGYMPAPWWPWTGSAGN